MALRIPKNGSCSLSTLKKQIREKFPDSQVVRATKGYEIRQTCLGETYKIFYITTKAANWYGICQYVGISPALGTRQHTYTTGRYRR
jgi:hypothetical protein